MRIEVAVRTLEETVEDAAGLGAFKNEKARGELRKADLLLGGAVEDFPGKRNQILELPTYGRLTAKKVLVVGLGERKEFGLDGLRQAAGRACAHARDVKGRSIAVLMDTFPLENAPVADAAQAMAEGAVMGTYKFRKYKKSDDSGGVDRVVLGLGQGKSLAEAEEGARRGRVIAEAVNYVRDVVNSPGNDATPSMLAEEAAKLAGGWVSCRVLERDDVEKLGMGAFLGVAQGSAQPPTFIVLDYNPKDAQDTVVLVGKAITFDSGGISIKPGKKMDRMKYDKAGGGTVLGVIKASAELKLKKRLIGLIPATENLPGGSALKPGDIITSASGKTIEVINTDAEGRLILADALNYALRYKPQAIIDIATLTGACVIALGNAASGLLGNEQALVEKLKKAGEASGERVWQLPLWREYEERIESDIADLKNVGGKEGGAITAASFLGKFVDGTPWAHLDIAGTAWNEKDRPYSPKGATGVGVRLLIEFLRRM